MTHEWCPLCGEGPALALCEVPEYLLGRRDFRVLRCMACGHSFAGPIPGADDLAAYYAEVVPRLRAMHGPTITTPGELVTAVEAEKVELLCEFGLLSPAGSVLDLGFGSGGFLIGMSQKGWHCTGVEIGDSDGDRALWAGLFDAHYGVEALERLAPASFDLITLWHVLEHLPDPIDVLQRAAQLLKPTGEIVVAVPNVEGLPACIFQSNWYAIAPPWHLHHFSPRTLHRVFTSAGLTVNCISGFGEQAMYLMWVGSLTNLIERRCRGRLGLPAATVLRGFRRVIAAFPAVFRIAETRLGRPGAVVAVGHRNDMFEIAQVSGTRMGDQPAPG